MPKGFLSYGAAKGLSHKHDFQGDIDRMYQREALDSQLQAQKEQKTKYYAELMKEHKPVAPSAVKELEGFYKDLNKRVSDFAIENPGFETDVTKMQEYLSMTDEYMNNDIVRKDIQSQEQFELLKQKFQSGEINKDQWEAEMDRYNDWRENGGDGYIYSGVKLPSYNDILQEGNAMLQPDTYIQRTGEMVLNVSRTPQQAINARALSDLQDPNKIQVIQKQFESANEMLPNTYSSALDYHQKMLSMGESEKRAFASWDPSWKADQTAKNKAQQQMMESTPQYTNNIASQFHAGNSITGHKGMEAFTRWGKHGRPINLGNEGEEVQVPDGNGGMRSAILTGELTLDNILEMKIMPDGAYIKAEVSTSVDPNESVFEKTYRINVDGNDVSVTENEFNAWAEKEDLSDREIRLLKEGDSVKNDGKDYSVNETLLPSKTSKLYSDAGFTTNTTSGIGDLVTGGKAKSYSGTVWVKADMTNQTISDYEAIKNSDIQKKAHQAGRLSQEQIIKENIAAGNTQFVSEVLSDTYGTPSYQKFYDSSGREVPENQAEVSEVRRSWQQHPNNPNYFYQNVVQKDLATGAEVLVSQKVYNSLTGQMNE